MHLLAAPRHYQKFLLTLVLLESDAGANSPLSEARPQLQVMPLFRGLRYHTDRCPEFEILDDLLGLIRVPYVI